MGLEVIAAALVGAAVLWLVLQPLIAPGPPRAPVFEPLDPEETLKGVALAALKEIEFDRETGKLSDEDYGFLKRKYTGAALEALRAEAAADGGVGDVEVMIAARVRALRSAATSAPPGAPSCPACGPRPEPDAVFCSTCGQRLQPGGACTGCGAELGPGSRFCERCGAGVAA
ncbi:MAG TPA: zinc ribbon domain-containing protein [Gemmatimonadales bacterium]|nr:zinc ribbon domain-containing protein [Gemmatimonadales bacterium]